VCAERGCSASSVRPSVPSLARCLVRRDRRCDASRASRSRRSSDRRALLGVAGELTRQRTFGTSNPAVYVNRGVPPCVSLAYERARSRRPVLISPGARVLIAASYTRWAHDEEGRGRRERDRSARGTTLFFWLSFSLSLSLSLFLALRPGRFPAQPASEPASQRRRYPRNGFFATVKSEAPRQPQDRNGTQAQARARTGGMLS